MLCALMHPEWFRKILDRYERKRERRESNDIGNEIKCQPDANLDKEPPNGSYLLYFIIYIFIIYIIYMLYFVIFVIYSFLKLFCAF